MKIGLSNVTKELNIVAVLCFVALSGFAAAQMGAIRIIGEAGLTVLLDGEDAGMLPADSEGLLIEDVAPGERRVELLADGVVTWDGVVTVDSVAVKVVRTTRSWPVQFDGVPMQRVTGLAVDADGTLFAGGYVEGTVRETKVTLDDAFIRALDGAGRPVWTYAFDTDAWDRLTSLAVGSGGTVVATGSSSPTVFGDLDAFVRAFDGQGQERWIHQFGTEGEDEANAVAVRGDGTIIVAGTTTGMFGRVQEGLTDGFVRALDGDGNVLWTRQFGTSEYDAVNAVSVGPDGTVFVAGSTQGALAATHEGSWDAFVVALDEEGQDVWMRQFGTEERDLVNSVAVASDGTVIAAGVTAGSLEGAPEGALDGFVRAFDGQGSVLWTNQFGSEARDDVNAVAVGSDGTVFAAGTTEGRLGDVQVGSWDGFVVALDREGRAVATRQFGTETCDDVTSVVVESSGTVFVAGQTCGEFGGPNPENIDGFVHRVPIGAR